MITRKQFVTAGIGFLATGILAACDSESLRKPANVPQTPLDTALSDDANSGKAGEDGLDDDQDRLTVAATSELYLNILEQYAAVQLADQNMMLVAKPYDDATKANEAVAAGEVDACLAQTASAFNRYRNEHNGSLSVATLVCYKPYAVYSKRRDSLSSAIPTFNEYGFRAYGEESTFAIPNDSDGMDRALAILAHEGLIEVQQPDYSNLTTANIVSNPNGIQFREMDPDSLFGALDEVDYVIADVAHANDAGMHVTDALVVEASDSQGAKRDASVLVAQQDLMEDERMQALKESLGAMEFTLYLQENYDQDLIATS